MTGADRTLRLLEAQVGLPLAEVETPVAVIDLDLVDRNLERLQRYATLHGIALWPHTKTHKAPELARRALELGAVGLTIAKSGEAEVMAQAGERILSHYPPLGAATCARLARLAADGTELTVALDGLEAAEGLARALAGAGASAEILIELDVGMHRTGVASTVAAVALAQQVDALPGLSVSGISCYPGHVGEPAELALVDERLRALRDAFDASGIRCTRISGGSTPTRYLTHTTIVNELRSGTYIFLDRNSAPSEPDGGIDACAMWVEAGVVSVSLDGQAVIDAGSKTLSSDASPLGGHGAIIGMPDAGLHTLTEEHGTVDVSRVAEPPRFGDHVQVIPNHVCVCVNLHDGLLGVRAGVVERVVRVEARGLIR